MTSDTFEGLYYVFVDELVRATGGHPAGDPPGWVHALVEQPFVFPPMLLGDASLASFKQRMETFALKWKGDPARVVAARRIVQMYFGTTNDEWRSAVTTEFAVPSVARAPTRGPTRGQRAKPPSADDAPLALPAAAAAAAPVSAAPSPPAATPVAPEVRYLNAGIQDRARDLPLVKGEHYALQFGVDLTAGGVSGTDIAERLIDASMLFREAELSIDLSIHLDSTDFVIASPNLTLSLPRRGPSPQKAIADISPLHEGRSVIAATVYKAGAYLLHMTIEYSVGLLNAAPVASETRGRPLAALASMQSREISLQIAPSGDAYSCQVAAGSVFRATIPITETQLSDVIARTRSALMDVVTMADANNGRPFQDGIAIDATSNAKALRTLAAAGSRLYRTIFYGKAAGADVMQLGDWLKAQLLKPDPITLQIVADRFPIPWGLLYLGDASDGAVLDWELFVGLRHIVEQLPLRSNMPVESSEISSAPELSIGVTVHSGIDQEMGRDVVAQQVEYWALASAADPTQLKVAQRLSRSELLGALRAPTSEQVMYFYCHATTKGPADAGGISASNIELTGNERLTLDDLDSEAPTRQQLPGQPLVFLNACESAELTPSFYDGFVPYFLAKGARGVVGTECKTPAVFATEWAMRFFPRFLAGEALGALFLSMRREFCLTQGNPMGLVYAVYCDAHTRIQPGLSS